jgi:hypothetical protein
VDSDATLPRISGLQAVGIVQEAGPQGDRRLIGRGDMAKPLSRVVFIGALLLFVPIATPAATLQQEIKRVYENLIDAENKHDLAAVKAMVWNSTSTLFVARAPVG